MATSSLEGTVTSANYSLVRDGWCWSYRKYVPGDLCWKGYKRTGERAGKVCTTRLGVQHVHGMVAW